VDRDGGNWEEIFSKKLSVLQNEYLKWRIEIQRTNMKHFTKIGLAVGICSLIIAPFAVNALSPAKPKPKASSKTKTSIVIFPKTAKQGEKVKATLKGFAPNSQLHIGIDTELGLTPYSFYSDKKGTGSISFTIPKSLPNDTYVLHATDAHNTLATTKIIVKGKQMMQTLSLDPVMGVAGTLVTFSGDGWLSKRIKRISLKGYDDNEQEVLMDFEEDTVQDLCANQSCAENETKVSVQIPQDAQVPDGEESGIYELVFSDGYNTKTIEFTLVNAEIPEPKNETSISLATSTLSYGEALIISGSGFASTSELLVKIGAATLPIKNGSAATDDDGSFKGSLIVLSSLQPGNHTVTVMDRVGNSAKASFEIKSPLGGEITGGDPGQKPVEPPFVYPITPTPKPTPSPTVTPAPLVTPTPTPTQCAAGETYSTTLKQCVKDSPTQNTEEKPTCPAGQTYSITFKQCF